MNEQTPRKKTRGLTEREQAFCRWFYACGDGDAAARKAGYQNPQAAAKRLLCKEEIHKELIRLIEEQSPSDRGRECYERLAFGDVGDAVSLLFSEEFSREALCDMDLFNIAEIKRQKGGGMEIKFYDRLRALEKLEERERRETDAVPPIYEAIKKGAEALYKEEESP